MAVSFKFTSTAKPKELKKGAIEDQSVVASTSEPDYVLAVAKNKIQTTKPEEKKKDVIIPCPKDGFKKALEECFKDKQGDSLEAAAISAVLKDADTFAGKGEEEAEKSTLVIAASTEPDPAGDKISRQVTVGDAADYEAVSIDDFGMAMLRGMGFKEGEGIGKTNKVSVKPVEVHVRPKGQGLGAGASRAKAVAASSSRDANGRDQDDVEEIIELRNGVKCMILSGPHKEKYATVDGLDAENSRVVIRLALGDKVLSMPESNVKAVSDKEFQRYSRYLNKASADQVRLETEKKLMAMRVESQNDDSRHKKDRRHRSRSRSRSRSSSRDRHRHHHRRDDKKGASNGSGSSRSREEVVHWLNPHLAVMIASGKYADQKGTISDVLTPTTCSLRLNNGKTIYDVELSQLVPIQPRRVGDACMALTGPNRRMVGEIIELDANGKYAAVQLAADQMTVISEKLSNLCVYTGSLDL